MSSSLQVVVTPHQFSPLSVRFFARESQNGKEVGFLDLEWCPSSEEEKQARWYIGYLDVTYRYRNKGAGSALLKEVIAYCTSHPEKVRRQAPITLTMVPDAGKGAALLRFYSRFGFKPKRRGNSYLVLQPGGTLLVKGEVSRRVDQVRVGQ
jgi:GNAT superfamily N-acetyltransferase